MSLFRRRFDQDYFESIFYRSQPGSRRNRKRLDLILAHKPGGRLLEIGCGRCDFLQLAASAFDVWAIDASPYAASLPGSELGGRVLVGDIESAPLAARSFDVIAAFNVLEHLRRPLAVLCKLHRALAPDGILVGSVPSNTKVVGTVYTAITNFFDRTHCSTYTVGKWRRAFEKAKLLEARFFGEIMLGSGACVYVLGPLWEHVALNMMFVAHKPSTGPA
jgi:SAM-dependent methyltransferase